MISVLIIAVIVLVTSLSIACYAAFFIWLQGDSNVVLHAEPIEMPELSGPNSKASVVKTVVFKNEGVQDAVLVDVRVSAPTVPGVLIEPSISRKGTRPKELSYWVSNVMEIGESCEGELTVEFSVASPEAANLLSDVSISVSYDEIARSLMVTKTSDIPVVAPPLVRTSDADDEESSDT